MEESVENLKSCGSAGRGGEAELSASKLTSDVEVLSTELRGRSVAVLSWLERA